MKKLFNLLLAIVLPLATAMAQHGDEAAVRDVITRLFKAMETRDTIALRNAFTPEVTMSTVVWDQSGKTRIRTENSIDGWVKAVGTPRPETFYEEIWNVKVNIDGDLAQAWCDYAFYIDKTFSHCGADAFLLVRSPEGWKIFHIADTRRKGDCEVPPEIRARRE